MATDYQSATMAAQPHHYQPQHAYRKSNLYGHNNSSSNSPTDISPTSTHTLGQMPTHNRHPQAIRALKTPGYIPAALRRTEKPGRQSPPNIDSGLESPPSGLNTSSPYTNSPGDMMPVNRIASEDMHSIYDDTPLSPVAGPITRNHWQPDSSTAYCTASCCQQPFGLFNRRHHCRKCGGIFCYQHTQKQVRLNELALFHPEGDWQKSCDRCHTQYREWEQMRSSRTNSESSGSSTAAMQIDTPPSKGPENTRVGSLAQSLGGGWNWSTF